MTNTVLILGAKGRMGRAAVKAFSDAKWNVKAFARAWDEGASQAGIERLAGDAFDGDQVSRAALDGVGCDVIVNALNPAYPLWADALPRLTGSVIQAAQASGATVIVPGNVYNYGQNMPVQLTEHTDHTPTTRKGKLRQDLETAFQNADGVQTIIVRAGDFIELEKSGNWFDSQIANKVHQGSFTYPGPLNQVHAWAYLPDLARAMVALAEKRTQLNAFEDIPFAGFGVTGQQLVKAIEGVCEQPMKVKKVPWLVIRAIGLFSPMMRELVEMEYLWRVPHVLDGAKLAKILPNFQFTPLNSAMKTVLGQKNAVTS